MTRKRHHHPRHLPVRTVPRDGGGIALEVGGVVQSVSVWREANATPPSADEREIDTDLYSGYWGLMLPPVCPRRALLLGLGGGTIAWLLAKRCPETDITGVERDAEVLALARTAFGLDALTQLTPVAADAFVWTEEQAERTEAVYDFICVDLFEAGRLAPGTLATPFLRRLAALLTPDGIMTINLMVTGRTPEQLHRLRRVFMIECERRLRGNLVVQARVARLPNGTLCADDGV